MSKSQDSHVLRHQRLARTTSAAGKRPRSVRGVSGYEKRKKARPLLEMSSPKEGSSTLNAPTSPHIGGGEGEASHFPPSSAPHEEGEPLRTVALSLEGEGSTLTIPPASAGSSREVASSMTEDSSEPLPPIASPGPADFGLGESSSSSETASFRKLSPMLRSFSPTGGIVLPPSERDCELSGSRVLRLSALREAAAHMLCPECESRLQFFERCDGRRGLVTFMSFQCPDCYWEHCVSDPGDPSSSVLNTRAILGSRLCGLGRSGISAVCGMLGLPPPYAQTSYNASSLRICNYLDEMADAQQKQAAKKLKLDLGHDPDEVVDIMVTCDCTWSKRGVGAAFGIVSVISWKTGEVLDCEILSKHCPACTSWDGGDKSSKKYEEWYKGHKDHCLRNHVGSSPAMEAEGVRRIWQRSVSRLGLRYTQVICNGDSSAYASVCAAAPYGEQQITRHECVGHAQKRVGKLLRDLRKDTRLKDKDGKCPVFIHCLSDENICKLQSYYGNAVRSNVGNLESMKRACWAVFYHSCSTDDNPQHDCCPKDKDTWCPYNRALVEKRRPVHTKPPRIPPDLAGFVKVCWTKLCDPDLLKGCVLGATQNQNESFHSVIWKYCRKNDFPGPVVVRMATYLASLTFNKGLCALEPLFRKMGDSEVGMYTLRYMFETDRERIKQSQRQASPEAKTRRKVRRAAARAKEKALIEMEGVTYESGAF